MAGKNTFPSSSEKSVFPKRKSRKKCSIGRTRKCLISWIIFRLAKDVSGKAAQTIIGQFKYAKKYPNLMKGKSISQFLRNPNEKTTIAKNWDSKRPLLTARATKGQIGATKNSTGSNNSGPPTLTWSTTTELIGKRKLFIHPVRHVGRSTTKKCYFGGNEVKGPPPRSKGPTKKTRTGKSTHQTMQLRLFRLRPQP